MKILVACEFSGKNRDAFAALGHEAWSCDLRESETPGNHYQGDVRDMLSENWDLLIAHPPCTYLSYAANHVWNKPGRAELREEAMQFFMLFVNCNIPRVCIENPVGYPGKVYRKPDQIIHPYYFGERELKRTCLWLKNLPKLWWWREDDLFGKRTKTDYPEPTYIDNTPRQKKRYFTDGGHGEKNRSKSFGSIAQAMAQQWGCLTKRVPDVWESAPLQAFSKPENSATSQALSTPPTRG